MFLTQRLSTCTEGKHSSAIDLRKNGLEDVSQWTSITPAFRLASSIGLTSLSFRARAVSCIFGFSHTMRTEQQSSKTVKSFRQYLVKRKKLYGEIQPHFHFQAELIVFTGKQLNTMITVLYLNE